MLLGLAGLLHVLVFVYWLGGDLGAFYSAFALTDPKRSVAERLFALKVLNAVDMAPRTALILTLPTGLTLAAVKGWLSLDAAILTAIWLVAGGWLCLAWALHGASGAHAELMRRADLTVRVVLLIGLVAAGGLALAGWLALPSFIAVKLLILAGTLACGLLIRRQLRPLFPAIRAMAASGTSPANDLVIARVIRHTRPVVLLIWALLIAAAWLGLTTPV